MVAKHAVRAAISPSFSVPFIEKGVDVGHIEKPSESSGDRCRVCDRDRSRNGTALLKCAKCHDAKYCSAECQRTDWKKHKAVCVKRT
jgi:hypothetical protein